MIANYKGYDLTSSATNGSPQPIFGSFDEYKRPNFIQFQYIFGLCRQQALFDRWLLAHFFLSIFFKVLRET